MNRPIRRYRNTVATHTRFQTGRVVRRLVILALLVCSPISLAQTDAASANRFLTQATFGPTTEVVNLVVNQGLSQWFVDQLAIEPSYIMPTLQEFAAFGLTDEDDPNVLHLHANTFGFWRNAIAGPDQLRQRLAFALSELLVVSMGGGEVLTDIPEAVAYYQDLLIEHAFGNYRDILQAVTYSPAMGYFLTYLGSEKGDPETGRMPDENYARELLQLFTIGVVELGLNGKPRVDDLGNPLETYDNRDITGLARVFTGLHIDEVDEDDDQPTDWARPMVFDDDLHSDREKSFLGLTIPANTSGADSINLALDHIFNHRNLAPFVGEQIIQRLVKSNPSRGYVKRVSKAFESGYFQLPDGQWVGTGLRGDMTALLAAVLFDQEARSIQLARGGKIREPLLRFTHWARAFKVENVTPEYTELLWDTSFSHALAQHPYQASSVFNFFRPGYVAPGTKSGSRGLRTPEMQLVNAGTIPAYANFMMYFVNAENQYLDIDELQEIYDDEAIPLNPEDALSSFIPDYSVELGLVDDPVALVEHLNQLLTYGTLSDSTRQRMINALNKIDVEEDEEEGHWYRVTLAILMLMTSPDYLVSL